MKIGIAGPVALDLLDFDFKGEHIPLYHGFPLMSYLVNGLMKRGHQIVIYSTSDKISEPFVYKNEQLTICLGRHEPHAGRDMFASERADLVSLMKKHPADIINAHWSYEFAWAAIDSGIPTVVTVRDHATTILLYQYSPYRVMRWIMNFIVLRRAKHLTTNSYYLWQLLTKKQQRKATIVSNFYASGLEKHFPESTQKSDYIVSVNNGFNKRKNVANGLLAFAILKKKYPNLQYHLIGSDMQEGEVAQRFAMQHNITDGVRFIGNKPFAEVIQTIKSAKVLLHTSREESFGNVVLEAMVVGTPVVGGAKSGNVPFLVNYGKAGLLCDVDSPEDIAKSVSKLIEDQKFASSVRQEAFAYAKANFSQEAVIDKYLDVYIKILNSAKKPSKVSV